MYLLLFLLIFSTELFANPAACALCTFAIAGGLSISRFFGVDDMVIGVWFGAILLAASQWAVYFFEKKNIKNAFINIVCHVLSYSLVLPLYWGNQPTIRFNLRRVWWIDSFLFSITIGTLVLFTSLKWYYYMKNKNGSPHFQFEKVVLPIISLIITSIIMTFVGRVI